MSVGHGVGHDEQYFLVRKLGLSKRVLAYIVVT